ncbi:MAG TPA: alpha/beta fold hydrolase [Vicinamibacterales bacterium]
MGKIRTALVAVCLCLGCLAAHAQQPPSIEGDWQGILAAGGQNLRLAFHIKRAEGALLTGTLDSLDQGALGLRIDTVTFSGSTVRFDMKAPLARYEGTLSADGSKIEGTWMQGGASLPLMLTRGAAPALKRPQEPKPPLPYAAEEVKYQNAAAGIALAGTLTLPRSTSPAPAVILISGSGPEDRDETVFGHKPFLILADHLTRNGIAVLRVDDRGVGGSSGKTSASTSEDFAGDVLAGVEYLKTRKEIDPKRIGLIGHSEGGLIAPIAANRSSDVAFIVLMAGPGLPGDQILLLQGAAIAQANGAPESAIAANRAVQEQIFAIVKQEVDPTVMMTRLRGIQEKVIADLPEDQRGAVRRMLDAQMASVVTPWFRYFLTYDPRPALSKVKVPVLAINGELDLQVPYKPNLDAIEQALKTGGNNNVTLMPLPKLNHLFQTATTGSPTEYSTIEETMAPAALDTITNWILKVVGPKS